MPCSCGQHRTPQGCAGARRLQTLTDAQRRMGGYRGGKTRAAQWKRAIEARLAALEAKLAAQPEQPQLVIVEGGWAAKKRDNSRRNHV